MARLRNPGFWRLVSWVALALFAVAFVVDGFSVPGWGWAALIVSGVAFGAEVLLGGWSRGRGAER